MYIMSFYIPGWLFFVEWSLRCTLLVPCQKEVEGISKVEGETGEDEGGNFDADATEGDLHKRMVSSNKTEVLSVNS